MKKFNKFDYIKNIKIFYIKAKRSNELKKEENNLLTQKNYLNKMKKKEKIFIN
jgi:hypothetical protein